MKILQKIKKKLKKGSTLLELIIGVTLYSVLMSTVLLSVSNLFKIQDRAKKNIYEKVEETNKINNHYFIQYEDD